MCVSGLMYSAFLVLYCEKNHLKISLLYQLVGKITTKQKWYPNFSLVCLKMFTSQPVDITFGRLLGNTMTSGGCEPY